MWFSKRSSHTDDTSLVERTADYLLALRELEEKYRTDPVVRHQQYLYVIRYWLIVALFNFVVGPVFILSIIWLHFNMPGEYFEYLVSSPIKVVWLGISMLGFIVTILFIPKREAIWKRLARKEALKNDPPFRHRVF